MRPILVKIFYSILFFVLFAGISSSLHARLIFDATTIEDSLEPGAHSYEFSFKFKNDGETPLKIVSLETNCGCMVMDDAAKIYSPGEEGVVRGIFNVGNKRGLQENSIILKTDSTNQSRIDLWLKIQVESPIRLSPRMQYWRKKEELKFKTITVSSSDAHPIEYDSADYDADALEIKIKQIGIGAIEIGLKPKRHIENGKIPVRITIKDGDGKKTTYVVYVLLK